MLTLVYKRLSGRKLKSRISRLKRKLLNNSSSETESENEITSNSKFEKKGKWIHTKKTLE